MPTEADPILSNWYQHLDKGQKFRVVALNEEQGLIEIQHFDGDLEEIDQDTWYELDLEPSEPPDNWAGPIDIGELDDLGTEITDTSRDDWDDSLQEVHLASAAPSSAQDDEELVDEWEDDRPLEEPWQGDG